VKYFMGLGAVICNPRSTVVGLMGAWVATAGAESLPGAPSADSAAVARPVVRAASGRVVHPPFLWDSAATARGLAAADSAVAVPGASAGAAPDSGRPVEYLWVLRTALQSPQSIEAMIDRARAMGVRGLLVQVVGRGDAWYRSDFLPRAEALPIYDDYDPLGTLLPKAHAAGLEVHAWINACLVWSAPHAPRSPEHVVRSHPEWIARLRDGRPMNRLGARERKRLGVEGIFLNPSHPGTRTWVARVAREVAARYPIDGIHLDYIRLPGVAVGSDPTSRATFALEHGVDPAHRARLGFAERARLDSAWSAFQAGHVTAIVREVRDSLAALRPGIALSAAVVADTITAERSRGQHWRAWLRDGLLDRAYVMSYAPRVQTVMDQLVAFTARFGVTDRIVPGIAAYNTSPSVAAAKIKGARALGYPLVALYSYDSIASQIGYWPALRDYLFPSERHGP
jgi:uncharacterized lipoprotein YddW (UPF0748 family)